jgi:hypothetical protein
MNDDLKKKLFERLKNIKTKSPALLVEDAAVLFREGYSKEIYRVENQAELKELVETFTNTPYSGMLVIEDLSKIYDMSVLLKFLEETETTVVLLAYKDTSTLTSTIKSRIKTYVKYPYNRSDSNLTNAKNALDLWSVEQDKSDQDRFFAQESPELYYLKLKSSRYKCNTKIVELLSTEA